MREWLSAVARLAAAAEGAIDEFRYPAGQPLTGAAHVVPYRGFGTAASVWVTGRVLRDPPPPPSTATESAWNNLLATFARIESDEVPGARVRLSFGGTTREAVANDEGFFEATIPLAGVLAPDKSWHEVAAELLQPPPQGAPAIGIMPVLIPRPTASFGVISDIDDTVLQTDVMDILRMARHMFLGNARTRLPFPGVAALYRSLVNGPGGSAGNPIFYVSSSPWNLYELLVEFFELQKIPLGPLMLRDWGLDPEQLLPTRHHDHKLAAIRRVMNAYPALPFVLIGDSGQADPEIYAAAVREYPGRIRAAYIRSIDRSDERISAIRTLATEVAKANSVLLLADDTIAIARDAAERGWITAESLVEIGADKVADATAAG